MEILSQNFGQGLPQAKVSLTCCNLRTHQFYAPNLYHTKRAEILSFLWVVCTWFEDRVFLSKNQLQFSPVDCPQICKLNSYTFIPYSTWTLCKPSSHHKKHSRTMVDVMEITLIEGVPALSSPQRIAPVANMPGKSDCPK